MFRAGGPSRTSCFEREERQCCAHVRAPLSHGGLEVEPNLRRHRPRRYIVRAAERRKEVIQRRFVGHIDGGQRKTQFVMIPLEQVVVADRDVEQVTGRDTRWIVVVILSSRSRDLYQRRSVLIAWACSRQRCGWCRVRAVAGKTRLERQITHVSGDAVRPDWSPDGRQIAFEIDGPGFPFCGIAIMSADGSGIVELTSHENVCENDPSFTPDGSRIVFDRFDPVTNDEAFWSMDLNGNDRQRIGPCCADPNVSPNGEKLSFLSFNGQPGGTALFTSSINGSNLFQVTPFSFDVAVKQDWAPDGQHLVFSKDGDVPIPGVSENIATIRPDGTHLRFVTHYEGGDVNAVVGSYSPDGRWIVFRLIDHGSFGLFKIHPDGTHLTSSLPLSNFIPRFIDWGSRPSERENEDDN
jgi:Tol biopolymer transport system component